jgi:hypothetical protein
MPIILPLGRLRQEDQNYEANLGYTVTPCLKKQKKTKKKKERKKGMWKLKGDI